jgi:cysteine desulfurase
MASRIYLDHAATTPLDPRVLEAMLPYLHTSWGNPSSVYQEAREARKGLDGARRTVAELLGARPNEVIFTSGGSESDNSALRGVAQATRQRAQTGGRPAGRHIITSAIEHHAILHTGEELESEGFRLTYLPVGSTGLVDLGALEQALDDDTILVSIMYANNEVGTIEPVDEMARLVKARQPQAVFHTDAVQAIGALDINVDRLGVDMLSIAAHKLYGPKGVGALYLRTRTPFQPQQLGGSQEKNRRAGTENVAGAVGLATAMRLASEESDERNARLRALRDRLLVELPRLVPGTHITGPPDPDARLPNNFSCCFERVEGEAVLLQLDLAGIAASSGSACTSGSLEPSHVLKAMGVPVDLARGSLRLTVGKDNTQEDIDRLLAVLPGIVQRLRGLSPLAGQQADPGRATTPSPAVGSGP